MLSTQRFDETKEQTTWILVARHNGAKLFKSNASIKHLDPPKEFAFPQARIRDSDTYRDRPVRPVAYEGGLTSSETPRRECEERAFATTLAEMLEKAQRANRYDKLVLVSEPQFLGVLRDVLSPKVKERITVTFEKDLEEMPDHLLGEYLLANVRFDHGEMNSPKELKEVWKKLLFKIGRMK